MVASTSAKDSGDITVSAVSIGAAPVSGLTAVASATLMALVLRMTLSLSSPSTRGYPKPLPNEKLTTRIMANMSHQNWKIWLSVVPFMPPIAT
jgi:hypothetical protein